jgi:hypothetical protein
LAFIALCPDDGSGHRLLFIRHYPEHGGLAFYQLPQSGPVLTIESVRVAGLCGHLTELWTEATRARDGLDAATQ